MRYIGAGNPAFGEDRRTYKVGVNGVASTDRAFNVSYDGGRVEAYLNGVRLFPDDDYTKTSSGIGTLITLASDIGANNVLEVVGYQGINSGNALVEDNFVVGSNSTGSGGSYSGSTTEFPVASSVGDTVSVWRNGVKLVPTTDFTVQPSTSKVTLGSGATSLDEITVQVVGGLIHNNGLTVNSGSNSFFLPTTRGTDEYVLTRDDSLGDGGTTWKEQITAPSITNVTGEINEDTNTTLTVTGSGFASGMTLKLINSSTGADITGHTSLSYSGSSSPLTVTIPSATANITANTQVKLHITKQGLTTTSNVITVSEDPNWTTTSGTFATIDDDLGASQTVGTLSASAGTGGGTIVYASDDSSLNTTYFSLNTSSGVITTTSTALTGLTGSGNYTEAFNANAKIQGSESTKNTLLSGINIIINKLPVGGDTITEIDVGGTTYRVHQFTTTGNSSFITYYELTGVEFLMIAGGGEGGAYVAGAQYYRGANGGDTIFKLNGASSNLVHCIGGGGGGTHSSTEVAQDGGSGGGGGALTTTRAGGDGTANQGFDGGDARNINGPYCGGGGGGSGSCGQEGYSTQGGHGGIGLASSITGTSVERAGGGGAGSWSNHSVVWGKGGHWSGNGGTSHTSGSESGGTSTMGGSNQKFGAGNGGINQAGGAGGANTGAGGGGGDTSQGAGHGGGGAGGYICTVAGETSGGGQSANDARSAHFSTLGASGQTTTYDTTVGAGGTTSGNTHGGDGGSGVIIIRYPK